MNELKNFRFERYVHRLFEFGVFIKGLNGIFEVVIGTFVLILDKAKFASILYTVAQGELLEDPHDRLINFVAEALQNLSTNTKIFAASYILFHGVLNIFLAIQLYRNKIWAYRVMLWVVSLAVVYQIYRVYLHHSITLLVITIIDILFIGVTLYEYRYQREVRREKTETELLKTEENL